MTGIGKRIARRRNELGMSQAELGRLVGMKQGSIGSIEAPDGVKRPRKLLELAAALKTTQEWLLSGEGDNDKIKLHENIDFLETIGITSAGVWRDASLGLPTMPDAPIVGPDPKYPADAQYLVKIEGNSMDLTAKDGAFAHCVDFAATGRAIQDGDLVLAVRTKPDGTVENTIKRVKIKKRKAELWPESSDPSHKPIIDNGDRNIDVSVKALVLRIHGPSLT